MNAVLGDSMKVLQGINDAVSDELLEQLVKYTSEPRLVILVGVGKSFCVAQLGAAILQSVGVLATAIHATDALHGGMGMIATPRAGTLILVSHSGETQEVLDVAHNALKLSPYISLVAITGAPGSALVQKVQRALTYDCPRDGSTHETIPTVSVTAQLAWLNVIACAHADAMSAYELGAYHPGGSLNQRYRAEMTSGGISSD